METGWLGSKLDLIDSRRVFRPPDIPARLLDSFTYLFKVEGLLLVKVNSLNRNSTIFLPRYDKFAANVWLGTLNKGSLVETTSNVDSIFVQLR